MLCIIQPWKRDSSNTNKSNNELIGVCLSLLAAVSGALVVVYSRFISQNIHNSIIGFYFALGTLILGPLQLFFMQR